MTRHLGLDDLADLLATDDPPPADDHLAGCDVCRDRLSKLRARTADVSSALGGMPGSPADLGPMPADVTLRITAALTAAHRSRPDELTIARERRSRRVRGWLAAAAAIVVVGGGFGAIAHFTAGRSSSSDTAAGSGAGEELSAQASANPSAARGVLLEGSFAEDAKAFVAARGQVKPPKPSKQSLAGSGSSLCATAATTQAATTAGAKAAGGNVAVGPTTVVGAVTVDGRPGVLYLVDVGPAKVAVALGGCSSNSPDVLASATL
ncbi:MAG TPA: hypothetical protein VIM10_01425 [Actinopolymorphaceae bacterium]|jgi:hypothetical protein